MSEKICCESGMVRVSYKIPIAIKKIEYGVSLTITMNRSNNEGSNNTLERIGVAFEDYPKEAVNFRKATIDYGEGDPAIAPKGELLGVNNLSGSDISIENIWVYFVIKGEELWAHNLFTTFYNATTSFTIKTEFYNFSYSNATGVKSCYYPDRWQYFDVETPKFNARDATEAALKWIEIGEELKILSPLDPRVVALKGILEGVKRFSLLRSCVVTAQQVFNPSQINIALGLEIGVLENLTLPFVGLEYQLNFWAPVPGFDQIIKTIQSPAGCPPPLIKLECCPEKGSCSEECPPGTCEVNCKGKRCCYDKNGKMVKQLN
jgi:hypothetical protein